MSNDLPILNQVRIPQPCPASWGEMTGDEQSRHCSQCDKSVFNLSNMTAAQAAAIVQEHRGDLCARVTRKADGSIVTLSERSQRKSFVRRLAAGFIVPLLLVLPGCSRENLPPAFADWLGVEQSEQIGSEMGDVMVEEGGYVALPEGWDTPDAPAVGADAP